MAHEIVYGICENKCKVEVYSKEYVDGNVPVVRYGTAAPDDSVGKDGDIYIQITAG